MLRKQTGCWNGLELGFIIEMIIWITQYISGDVYLILNVNTKSILFSLSK